MTGKEYLDRQDRALREGYEMYGPDDREAIGTSRRYEAVVDPGVPSKGQRP